MMTYNFTVCPHDTAQNLPGWFFLNTYLQRQTGMAIHFEPFDDFDTQRRAVLDGRMQIVYANPFDAALYARELGFLPLVRRASCCDEAYILARAECPITDLSETTGGHCRLSSATDKTAVHALGIGLLKQAGACRDDFDIKLMGNYVSVVKALIKGDVDLGIVFDETYKGLSDLAKSQLKVLGATGEGQTFHLFCVSPELAEKADELSSVLIGMQGDEKGQRCLQDLGFQGFERVDEEAFARLVMACDTTW
jgi:phosphonate transport system substrate-binding protein